MNEGMRLSVADSRQYLQSAISAIRNAITYMDSEEWQTALRLIQKSSYLLMEAGFVLDLAWLIDQHPKKGGENNVPNATPKKTQ